MTTATVDTAAASDLDAFRSETAQFLGDAIGAGVACPAYGAILVPALHEQARVWQRHCYDHGWAGLHWPVEHGGRGLSRAHTGVWMEECERAGVAPYLNLQGIVLAGEAVMRTGTEAQRERFLRPILTGEDAVVPAVQRARERLGPGRAHQCCGARRRPFCAERTEGVVVERAVRRVRHS